WRNPGDPGEWPFGSELVLRLVNPLEKTFPILDNLGIREALWFALRRLPEPAGPLHRRDLLLADALTGITREERLKHLAWFLLHRLCPTHQASFFHMLWRLLVQNEEDLRSGSANRRAFRGLLFTFRTLGRNPLRIFQEMLGDRQTAAAKGILGGDVSHTIGRPGPVPRHVLFGHTHRPRLVRLAGGRSYANTGSWRMRILPRGRASFRVEQSLDYVRAMPGNGGGWRLIPGCWADEWPLQADPAGHS
ncbi:MAG TPA: hypothetical protein PLB62_00335, partial [Candidatus Sumerlaeota bacterium]|nr:hypothetical protein [Candidatus Sumerlaeota bacterium]